MVTEYVSSSYKCLRSLESSAEGFLRTYSVRSTLSTPQVEPKARKHSLGAPRGVARGFPLLQMSTIWRRKEKGSPERQLSQKHLGPGYHVARKHRGVHSMAVL